jgi:hypothetical protein
MRHIKAQPMLAASATAMCRSMILTPAVDDALVRLEISGYPPLPLPPPPSLQSHAPLNDVYFAWATEPTAVMPTAMAMSARVDKIAFLIAVSPHFARPSRSVVGRE